MRMRPDFRSGGGALPSQMGFRGGWADFSRPRRDRPDTYSRPRRGGARSERHRGGKPRRQPIARSRGRRRVAHHDARRASRQRRRRPGKRFAIDSSPPRLDRARSRIFVGNTDGETALLPRSTAPLATLRAHCILAYKDTGLSTPRVAIGSPGDRRAIRPPSSWRRSNQPAAEACFQLHWVEPGHQHNRDQCSALFAHLDSVEGRLVGERSNADRKRSVRCSDTDDKNGRVVPFPQSDAEA